MKHFYCGRLTEVVLTDITIEATALDLRKGMAVETLVVAHTSDVTEELLASADASYPTAKKILITTQAEASYEGWDLIVVPILTLPLIQSVLEG